MVSHSNLDPYHPIHRDNEIVYLQVISYSGVATVRVTLGQVSQMLQRALNTWSDVPPELMTLSDKLEKL